MFETLCFRRVKTTAALCAGVLIATACSRQVPGKLPRAILPPLLEPEPLALVPPGLPAVVVAELGTPDKEVRFARNGNHALVATRSGGQWLVGPIRVDRDDDSALSPVNGQSGMRPVCPATDGPAVLTAFGDGFLLAWVDHVRRETVWALPLDAAGKPTAAEKSVGGYRQDGIGWLDVQSSGSSAYLIWDGGGTKAVIASYGGGKTATVDVGRAWSAAASPDGLFIASVSNEAGDSGRVAVDRVASRQGELAVQRTAVSDSPTALADIQVAALDQGALIGWTDRAEGDSHVIVASLGKDGRLHGPRAIDPVGDQGLLSLVASGDRKRALIAWEPEAAPAQGRTFSLAVLAADGSLQGARGQLAFAGDNAAPQLLGDGPGFAALTLAPLSQRGEAPERPPIAPFYLLLGADLSVRAAAPIRIAALATNRDDDNPDVAALRGVPQAMQSPACAGGVCTAIARGGGNPSLLALVKLPPTDSGWAPPARRLAALDPPMAQSLRTIADVDWPIADLDAAELADGRVLVAWVGFADAPAGQAPPGQKLQYLLIDPSGRVGPVQTLSEKAIAVGGVAVEPLPAGYFGPGEGAVAAIAWVGPDQGSQVFVSTIGRQGEKRLQRSVTRIAPRQPLGKGRNKPAPTEVYDVAVARDQKGGLVCAWSDTRSGDAEIYAARIDNRLDRRGNEVRVTSGKALSVEPALAVDRAGQRVLVAWSQQRSQQRGSAKLPGAGEANRSAPASATQANGAAPDGSAASFGAAPDGSAALQGDIWLAVLDGAGLKPIGAAKELYRSPGNSRTPAFYRAGQGFALGWIEEPARSRQAGADQASDASTPGARLLALDGNGQPLAQLRSIGGGQAMLTSEAFACEVGAQRDQCRGFVAGSSAAELLLTAVSAPFDSGTQPADSPLAALPSPTLADVRLAIAAKNAERVIFAQERNGRTRIRELRVRWER